MVGQTERADLLVKVVGAKAFRFRTSVPNRVLYQAEPRPDARLS